MKRVVIFASLFVILAILKSVSPAVTQNEWLAGLQDDIAAKTKLSLSDVILQSHRLRTKRAVRRFKRWWWCENQDPKLPGCPHNKFSKGQRTQSQEEGRVTH